MPEAFSEATARSAVMVLTEDEDATADVVTRELAARGIEFYTIDSSDFPLSSMLTGAIANDEHSVTLTDVHHNVIPLSRIRSVWCRRPGTFGFPATMAPSTARFARSETRQAFSGLLQAEPLLWINEPRFESLANLKAVQLATARSVGLDIPRTLITNDPAEATRFFDEATGEILYKRMAQRMLLTEDGGVTAFHSTKLEPRHREFIEQVRVAPCCFQDYIEKAYELRVTVVGEKVFAARIDSQSLPETAVDWRVDSGLPWHPYTLPEHISAALIAYLKRFKIVFGAFDLIRTPAGGYVFVECNAAGQWAWFDDEITLSIRDALVEMLVMGQPESVLAHPAAV